MPFSVMDVFPTKNHEYIYYRLVLSEVHCGKIIDFQLLTFFVISTSLSLNEYILYNLHT